MMSVIAFLRGKKQETSALKTLPASLLYSMIYTSQEGDNVTQGKVLEYIQYFYSETQRKQ